MVCSKCQKLAKPTALATPAVKKKSEMYYGSSAGKSSPTVGNNGIGKSKLLSKSAKNPYAAYSSSCSKCKTKVEAGRTYCQRCAYQQNACAMCGKSNTKSTSAKPAVSGQKFTMK